ncbi:MAG: GGDEF domain-containing protein [Betaproteobacteria bacterium]|nr:GGDEF domain-containing protein [Betaproteobacteria bacterium]
MAMGSMAVDDSNQRADTRSLLAANKFPLLRRLSINSLAAMLITATILIFLYRQDQLAEHQKIATQDNEKTAIHLLHLLGYQINTLVVTSNGLDTQALQTNPNIDLFNAALELAQEHDIFKLKIYNLSGATIYSSARSEIGGTSTHPDMLAKALRGEVMHQIAFRDAFLSKTGVTHDVYVVLTYMPLTQSEKPIGAIEVYADATPVYKHIYANTIRIALIVFCVFAALYATLFFSVRRTDRAVTEWQKLIAKFDEKIHNMAFHDALTQLPNRHLLEDRLVQTMAASKRSGRYGALMFLDLDNFKSLNDRHGHVAGDLLLREVAHRLTGCVREVDTVARFGGDEFVVLLSELDVDKAESTTQAGIVAEKIRIILAEPYVLTIQHECEAETITVVHHCTSSIGVVVFINHESNAEDILKLADMAMYQAKENGRDLIRFFDSPHYL